MPRNSRQYIAGPCIQGSQHSNGRNRHKYVCKNFTYINMYVKKIFQTAVSAVNKTKKGDTVDSE